MIKDHCHSQTSVRNVQTSSHWNLVLRQDELVWVFLLRMRTRLRELYYVLQTWVIRCCHLSVVFGSDTVRLRLLNESTSQILAVVQTSNMINFWPEIINGCFCALYLFCAQSTVYYCLPTLTLRRQTEEAFRKQLLTSTGPVLLTGTGPVQCSSLSPTETQDKKKKKMPDKE